MSQGPEEPLAINKEDRESPATTTATTASSPQLARANVSKLFNTPTPGGCLWRVKGCRKRKIKPQFYF
ncbi:hypothetical protein HDU96_003712, partial [Phlyctochytrium bullatum]